MIDLKEDIVKDSIQIVKNAIEKEILDSFEIKIKPLYEGKLHEGAYWVQVSYIGKGEKVCSGAVRIKEDDYNKHIKKV